MSRQTARSLELGVAAATQNPPSALALASGHEQPVRSPALELQEALAQMLISRAQPSPQPITAVAVGLGLMGVASICGAFWFALGRILISLA